MSQKYCSSVCNIDSKSLSANNAFAGDTSRSRWRTVSAPIVKSEAYLDFKLQPALN